MIYLPITLNSNDCVEHFSDSVFRVHSSSGVYDFYLNEHYQSYPVSHDVDYVPTCLDHNQFTSNVWYRNDISDIMVTFGIFLFFVGFLILLVFKSFFRGFLR